jgi:phosphohistidine phosphatase
MQVYLLRHGISEDEREGLDDASRALTAEGRKKLRQVLRAAVKAEVMPSLIVSSPLKRAVETADIAKSILGYHGKVLQSMALLPGATPEQAWKELRLHHEQSAVLLVGHNPLFSDLARYLLNSPHLRIDFKKGAMMRLDIEHITTQPSGVLRWYLTAKLSISKS